MFNDDITVFAETTFRNKNQKFGIKTDDRRRHMYFIGKTGMGKSTILENMIIGDIRAGKGVAVVDPHGDLAEKIIDYIPASRINDVVYFNPADMEYPIAFNVVEHVEPHLRHLVASGLLGVFQKIWADSWGPRLEYILRNSILAVLDYPGSTLLAVTRMLSDKKFRKKVVDKIQNPVVKAFWVNEFASYSDRFATEAVSSIQNKVGQFLSSSLIRNIVGQVKSSVDMRKIMDEGKILIINLSKGRIGEDNSRLLGAMMITKIQLAAMSRVDIEESKRKDFYLYVDEFQNFATDSFANILSEARKYRLNLTLAHQYIEQVEENVRNAIFGNVGTLIVFRVGAADAEWLVPEFTPTFTEEDIVNLPKYEIYLKLMIDGIASEPFSARGLHPLSYAEKTGNTQKVISTCRERYAKSREVIEDKINRWHIDGGNGEEEYNNKTKVNNIKDSNKTNNKKNNFNVGEAAKNFDDSVYKHEAKCSRCGKDTKISFKPDGIRPIYCRDCLTIIREEKKQEFENRKELKSRELEKIKNKPENIVVQDVPAVSLKDALAKPPVKFKTKPQRQFNNPKKIKTNILGEGEEIVF
ncbi:type IV secretion system DNA-binding domain-containing protein [Candidatus Parcubacteria bacterium]|nr:type IV secretion system DNA-binding domain-containing protein [Candidatus Parcubacteria bacterium]